MSTGTAQPDLPVDGGWTGLVETLAVDPAVESDAEGDAGRSSWIAAGLGDITLATSGQQLAPVGPFVARMEALAAHLPVEVAPLGLLRERSAIAGLRGRRSPGANDDAPAQSVGGTAWIMAAADGWFCLNLARHEDAASLPALLEADVDHRNWDGLQSVIRQRSVANLDYRALLLGMPAGAVPGGCADWPEANGPAPGAGSGDPQLAARQHGQLRAPFLVDDFGEARFADRPVVLDLTSLWAGPLCGSLLADAGCRVIKVEGRHRPDGARSGPKAFFDLLNGGKECIALDFADPNDLLVLDELLDLADVVLEGSRPRVMAGLGIDPWRHARQRRSCWVSITAYGRTGPWSNRVGFGDDVAATAGVVSQDPAPDRAPRFVSDAIADPVGGCVAAVAAWHALSMGRSAVIDVALREALGFQWGHTTLAETAAQATDVNVRKRRASPARAFDADGARIRELLSGNHP